MSQSQLRWSTSRLAPLSAYGARCRVWHEHNDIFEPHLPFSFTKGRHWTGDILSFGYASIFVSVYLHKWKKKNKRKARIHRPSDYPYFFFPFNLRLCDGNRQTPFVKNNSLCFRIPYKYIGRSNKIDINMFALEIVLEYYYFIRFYNILQLNVLKTVGMHIQHLFVTDGN